MKRVGLLASMCGVAALLGCGSLLPNNNNCGTVQCGPCAPALTLKITDPDGHAVPGVEISGEDATCGDAGAWTECAFSSPGALSFDVSAAGYQTAHVQTEVPIIESEGCCSCGYESQIQTVVLQPS